MQNWQSYKYAFLGTAPLALIGMIWEIWGLVYMGIFFGLSLWLLLERKEPVTYVNSSAATHYQYGSRFNQHNYIFAGILILSSLIIALSPLPIALNTLISWTLAAAYLHFLLPAILLQLGTNLISDYLVKRLPALDITAARKLVFIFQNSTEQELTKWSKETGIEESTVAKAFTLFEKYIARATQDEEDEI